MDKKFIDQSISKRRGFIKHSALGTAALSQLLGGSLRADGAMQEPHFAPKAKRVIYLFQSGGPSQLELMDYKPKLKELHGTELPDSIRNGPAPHRNDFGPEELSCRGTEIQIPAVW